MLSQAAMMRVLAVLVLLFATATVSGAGHEETDFVCPATNKLVASTLVCDGTVHCPNASESRYDDEWSLCVPAPYLQKLPVVVSEVTGTSVLLSWSGAMKRIPDHPLKLAGYFLTAKAKNHSFQDRLDRRRLSHRVEGLNPSTLYAFILRPYYTDDGVSKMPRKIGRAGTVEVHTLPPDQFQVTVEFVNSTAAVISWRMLEPGKRLVLRLEEVLFEGVYWVVMVQEYHKLETELSTYNVFLGNLKPWTHYVAIVDDCSAKYCKQAGNGTFITPPDGLPSATVTGIQSRRPGSFELEWTYPEDQRPYHGFRVRYCEDWAVVCSLVFTRETNITVEGLENDTVYNVDVRAQFKIPNGRVVLGPPQTASVITWSDVPVLSLKHEANVNDLLGASVLSWKTHNTSVGYFEYRFDEEGSWTPCNESLDCNVTVVHEKPALRKSGFIGVRHYKTSGEVKVTLEGATLTAVARSIGLHSLHVWKDAELEAPAGQRCHLRHTIQFDTGFQVQPDNYSALLSWQHTGDKGFEVQVHCGEAWEIHYEKSMHPLSFHEDPYVEVKGLPLKAEECEFHFSTYETRGNITHYDKTAAYYPEK